MHSYFKNDTIFAADLFGIYNSSPSARFVNPIHIGRPYCIYYLTFWILRKLLFITFRHSGLVYSSGDIVFIRGYCIHQEILYSSGDIVFIRGYCIHQGILYSSGDIAFISAYCIYQGILWEQNRIPYLYPQRTDDDIPKASIFYFFCKIRLENIFWRHNLA